MEAHLNENYDHVPYNLGYARLDQITNKKNVTMHYGYGCMKKFVEDLDKLYRILMYAHENEVSRRVSNQMSEKDIMLLKFRTKNKYVAKFCSHNGGRYDHFILLKENIRLENMIKSNGILSMSCFEGYINFCDFYKHYNSSLSSLCDSFQLDKKFSKTEFPHDFINQIKNIEYLGPEPDCTYWPSGKVPIEFQGTVFDLKKVSIEYQILDVIALGKCFESYVKLCYDITKLNASNYLTSPSLSYNYVIKHLTDNYQIENIKNLEIDQWMRKSIHGGRCFVQKAYYETEHYQEVKNFKEMNENQKIDLYNKITDFLVDVDATSLYPSAMSFYKYPSAPGHVVHQSKFQEIQNQINRLTYRNLCILECDIEFNNPDFVCPLISTKNKDGTLSFDFKNKNKIQITNVDIEEAIKYNNAKITKIYNIYEWTQLDFIFKEAIQKMFEERLKNKRNALGSVLKIIMNSSYGKFIQHLIDEKTEVFDSNNKFEECLLTNKCTGFTFLCNNEKVMCSIEKDLKDKDVKSASYLGSFILAYSKRIMNNCIDAIDGFKNWDNTFNYTDTDSLIIKNSLLEKIKNTKIKYPGLNQDQLHDNIDIVQDGKIIKGIWIRPKLYLLEVMGKDHKTGKIVIDYHVRSKGINSKYLEKINNEKLVEDYAQMLNGSKVTYDNLTRFNRNWKQRKGEIGIKTITETKVINQQRWEGRVFNATDYRWLPIL
jgi:hypothetical protein